MTKTILKPTNKSADSDVKIFVLPANPEIGDEVVIKCEGKFVITQYGESLCSTESIKLSGEIK